MSQFRFKNERTIVTGVGKHRNISNHSMTDEKAIAFLKANPNRIVMFSQFPDNWKELISGAESVQLDLVEVIADVESEDKPPCPPCFKKKLKAKKMAELKEEYPEVKTTFGMKKVELIEAIIAFKYPS